MCKNVLLIGGGGTLGTYTAENLLKMGHKVDILCPEDKISDNENLVFYKGYGTEETLKEMFSKKDYDGIVNFIHYQNIEEYKPMHKLLCENTDHLIFLSSYRVYADKQSPITESAPQLLDVSEDEDFVAEELYAIKKAEAERYIRSAEYKNWTIVRPVISFSQYRFDLFMYSGDVLIEAARGGITKYLPLKAKNLTAGIDWAGNSGKLIANLLFKKEAIGKAFTISSVQNLTWGQVAEIYSEVLGIEIEWVSEEEYLNSIPPMNKYVNWQYLYDRLFDRKIDNSAVLNVTGLKNSDFTFIKEGLKTELKIAGVI